MVYSQTCIKRSPLGQRKNGLIRQVTSEKMFNSYEIFYDRTRKREPFNTGDYMGRFDCTIFRQDISFIACAIICLAYMTMCIFFYCYFLHVF